MRTMETCDMTEPYCVVSDKAEKAWRYEIELALAFYVVKMGINKAGDKLSWHKASDVRDAAMKLADSEPVKQAIDDLLKHVRIEGYPPQ